MLTKQQVSNLEKLLQNENFSEYKQLLENAISQWSKINIKPLFENFGDIELKLEAVNDEKISGKYYLPDNNCTNELCIISACLIDKYYARELFFHQLDDLPDVKEYSAHTALIYNLSKDCIDAIICGYDNNEENFENVQYISKNCLLKEFQFGKEIRNALLC